MKNGPSFTKLDMMIGIWSMKPATGEAAEIWERGARTGYRWAMQHMFDDPPPNWFVEMRWVVTPDLDGRQLQYRFIGKQGTMGLHWSDWCPVHTEFELRHLMIKHLPSGAR